MTSVYDDIIKTYKENMGKPWTEWLRFVKNLNKGGKQGLVGLLETTDGKHKCLFKLSQYINFLVHHEGAIAKSLDGVSKYCPHFCKYVGTISSEVDPTIKKEGNPFNSEGKFCIKKDVLLLDYIGDSCKFYNFIRANDVIQEHVLYSTIKQVLLAISIAKDKINFTHYDLHSNNIMMKKCNKNIVFLYSFDNENQFAVPTYGYYPIIIDFGFSYSNALENGPLWPSLGHTEIGFTSYTHDPFADPKLFLVTVSTEIKNKRGSKSSKKLRRVVRNIFDKLSIDWSCGWDKGEKNSIADKVEEIVEKEASKSLLFGDYFHYCIDLLQTLVYLPLKKKKTEGLRNNMKIFLTQWCKIEDQISSSFYHIYILKCMINIAREIRGKYFDPQTKNEAVNIFKDFSMLTMDSVAKFCRPKEINWEAMLCSMYLLAENIEGLYYKYSEKIRKKKEKIYERLPLKTTLQIFGAIDINIPSKYKYTKDTIVCLVDSHSEKSDMFKIPEEDLDSLNSLHSITQGTFLYDIYKKTH